MGYTVTNGDIVEVSFKSRYQEQRCISLFHYRYETQAAPVDGVQLINTLDAALNTNVAGSLLYEYLNPLNQGLTMEQLVYQWVFSSRRPRIVKVPTKVQGGTMGPQAPVNVALAITKRSDVANRHGIATLHMPGHSQGGLNNGEWSQVYVESFGNLLTQLHRSINIEFGINLVPVIYNRVEPAKSIEITSANSNYTIRTMHRRTVGVGE